jgi:hypothetical protein
MSTSIFDNGRFAILWRAFRAALAWRLLLLWTAALLVPAALAALPMWRWLVTLLDFSPAAADFARKFDVLVFEDLSVAWGYVEPPLVGAAAMAALAALLVNPWLTGMTMAAASDGGRLSAASLFQRGFSWYGRALRIWLLSLVPWGIVAVVSSMTFKSAGDYAERAVRQAEALRASRGAALATLVLSVLVHVCIEIARAELAADPQLRSVLRAFSRGAARAARHPLLVLGLYAATTAASLAVAGVFLLVRLRIDGATPVTFGAAFIVAELAVAAIGWGRASRLFALTELARSRTIEFDGPTDTPLIPVEDEVLPAGP